MKGFASAVIHLVLLLGAAATQAQLVIEITQGVDNPTSIAVVPFAFQGAGTAPEDVAGVVDGDLARSGQFAPVGRSDRLGLPSTEAELSKSPAIHRAVPILSGVVNLPAASWYSPFSIRRCAC